MSLPVELENELRATMCPETYDRVKAIMDRWLDEVHSFSTVSGLEELHNGPGVYPERERVALDTLGNLITHDADSRHLVERRRYPEFSRDATTTEYRIRLLRAEPRTPAAVRRHSRERLWFTDMLAPMPPLRFNTEFAPTGVRLDVPALDIEFSDIASSSDPQPF